jgi:glycerophosphoryl diester phosphodiesterase
MKGRKIFILGHRGYSSRYPENTFLAFKKAFEAGADGIECDIQKTDEGFFLVTHDVNMLRLVGLDRDIRQMNIENIRELDFGSGENVPDFDVFLEVMPLNKIINIELKDETITPDDAPEIIDRLKRIGSKEHVIISSFRHDLLPAYKNAGYMAGMLIGRKNFEKGVIRTLFDIKKYKPDFLNIPVQMFYYLPRFVSKIIVFVLRVFKTDVILWTLNTEDEYKLLSPCATGIITDNIEELLEIRKRYRN